MLYEHRSEPPIPRGQFVRRLLRHFAVGGVLVAGSLVLGMAGYMGLEHLGARAAFLNAAMLLGGMGPVDVPRTPAGQLFAGAYALYCGLVFLVLAALLLTPVFHRVLHRFHWEWDEEEGRRE